MTTPRIERLDREIAAILVLAEMAREDAPQAPTTRVWLMVPRSGPTPPGSVRRAGGVPIGVDEETRPRWNDGYQHHLVTLDLDEVPTLRSIEKFANARAVAVFVSDHLENDASTPGTDQTTVLALSEADIAKGEWTGPPVDDPDPCTFFLVPVDVPTAVFDEQPRQTTTFDSLEADDRRYDSGDKLRVMLRAFVVKHASTPEARLVALRSELMNNDHVGGRVIHWSANTYDEDFMFQFTEDLLDVNLGDAGTMYVFAKTAFWAGH